MAGDYHKATIDNLRKQGNMRAQVSVSKEIMRRFRKYDVKLVSKRRD